MGEEVKNLYVHFPFCRGKCTYCALHSKAGIAPAERNDYVKGLANSIPSLIPSAYSLSTIYFGGGSPALCELRPLFAALSRSINASTEFTVELHPLDATVDNLKALKDGGVNRISMGLQSISDDTLKHMRRGYAFDEAERAFHLIKDYFDNAGVDLIVGYPGDRWVDSPRLGRLANWGLKHCSAYSLILEENSALHRLTQREVNPVKLYSDEETMDELGFISHFLDGIGLKRYEISNYSVPGYECRHNMATWAGEDYYGLGTGAHGRIGLERTRNQLGEKPETETVSEEFDFKERRLFRLRTAKGLDASDSPDWIETLDQFTKEGLLEKENLVYRLTERGFEVCDSILAELI